MNRPDAPRERGLPEDPQLQRLYQEMPDQQPPERLGCLLRQAARDELEKRRRAARPGFLETWFQRLRLPFAALASGVLVVTISLQVLHEKGEDGLADPYAPSTPAPAAIPAPPAPRVEPPHPASAPQVLPSKSLGHGLAQDPPPEEWLTLIRDLLQQGQEDQAREELAAFLRAHPKHALPEDLRPLSLHLDGARPESP